MANALLPPALYTTVVRTNAQLLAALAAPDDFFIVAGSYSVDLSTITISTTPKHIQGAGMEEVAITISTTTGFNFLPARTTSGGVTMADLSIIVAASFTFSVLEGLWAGERIRIDSASLGIWSFNNCNNLTDCVSLNASNLSSSAGYFACNGLENCRAVDCAALGFSACIGVSGCRADLSVAAEATAGSGQFHTCVALSGCVVFITGTTTVVHWAFTQCERMSGCWAELPATTDEFKGFDRCEEVAGCRLDRGHSGFDACIHVAGCSVANAQVGPGFEDCLRISGCFAETGAATGFLNCEQVSACRANANVSHGFSGGQDIAGCESTGSTAGWGYATAAGVIDGLSTSSASGNSLGAEDGTATRKINNTFPDDSQYALLAGRAGGQTLIGGTAAGEDLTLQSTSHATRGDLIVDAAQVRAPAAGTMVLALDDGTPWATLNPGNDVTIDTNTEFQDDLELLFGTTGDASFTWSTGQTADGLLLALGMGAGQAGSLIITALANIGSDHGRVAATNPTLYIFSASDPTFGSLEHISLSHNGTDGIVTVATGALNVQANLLLTASVDSAAVADQVSLGRFDIGAGNTVLAISQETAVVVEVDETKFSHKGQVRWNGVNYFVMLTTT